MATKPHDSPSGLATQGVIQFIADVRQRVAEVVVGQDTVVERMLIALFTGGHILLQGVPGIAKTLLASSLSRRHRLEVQSRAIHDRFAAVGYSRFRDLGPAHQYLPHV